MAVLFASYFYNTVSCTLPKAPGLPGVAEAEGNNTKRQKYSDGNLLPSLCLCFFVLDFVGKCDIGIINADHALTEEETQLLRKHPELGADYLKGNYHFSTLVYAGVMQHHENYDGTGYPLGKSGEHIPLYARIIRLVEQYDNMVSLHRGRENLSPSDAMEYLMAGSGSLFDPKLVELFVEKIAVYPVGCEVELSNGMHGVVAKNFERFFLRPVVKVVETGEMLNLRDDPDTRSIIITKMVIH